MYKDLINSNVSVLVSSKGDTILEYTGTLVAEDENNIVLANVDIDWLMLQIQARLMGGNSNQYKKNVEKVILNKKYIISCNK